ncbi:MAG: carbamoyltransferase [Acidimicrobiaceae bacterium]
MTDLVLGLHLGHDATATLIDGNRIVCAIAEERLSRRKFHVGFPHRAVERALAEANVKPVDVAAVGLSTRRSMHPHHPEHVSAIFAVEASETPERSLFGTVNRIATTKARSLLVADEALDQRAISFSRDRTAEHLRNIGFTTDTILGFSHHHAHAASAYYTAGVERAAMFTLDGQGDRLCASVSLGCDGRIEPVMEIPDDTSPGLFYAMVTKFLGFKPNQHEGKITGLAAYGTTRLVEDMSVLLSYDAARGCFAHGLDVATGFASKLKTLRRLRAGTNEHMPYMNLVFEWLADNYDPKADAEDVAAGAQHVLERVTNEWITDAIARLDERPETMLLAGGVFANVRLNQLVAEQHGASEVHIHQNMGDGGLATGAAYLAQASRHDVRPVDHPTVYFGPAYGADAMRSALEEADVTYREPDDLVGEIATLLHAGQLVARYAGGMEYGPRALGNRSILAAPNDRKINDWLNERLGRTEFMPFAPAVLDGHAADLLVGYNASATVRASRFMTVTYDVVPEWHDRLEAVVHVDGTARPQVVRRQDNPSYYDIIDAYFALSGIPAIINTSFNMHEEPIVESPADAIRAFKAGHLDHLALGPFLCSAADL